MPRMLSLLLFATMPLSACAPAADAPTSAAPGPASGTTAASAPPAAVDAPTADTNANAAQPEAAGARDYRIAVAPGRYYLLGWVEGGELALIAHASQIRCIRAPCPPDELIEVEVAAGEHRDGIDLAGAYVEVPAGWPARP